MRINSQNNQFVFNLPHSMISKDIEDKFQILMDKNFVQYNDVMDYLNGTIKDLVFPSLSFEKASQKAKHGKNINYREAGNIADKFQGEVDITFRSVDSSLNYFLLLEICNRLYLQDNPNYAPTLNIDILDKDGDKIYTILLKSVLISSLSEKRLSYSSTDFSEETFSLQLGYNFIDILWDINRDKLEEVSIFDIEVTNDPRDISGLIAEMEDRMKK